MIDKSVIVQLFLKKILFKKKLSHVYKLNYLGLHLGTFQDLSG